MSNTRLTIVKPEGAARCTLHPAFEASYCLPCGTATPVGMTTAERLERAECSGSRKPVGAGSACGTCGTSFGHPHPANLVVGMSAPSHAGGVR